ncbi:bifunctional folylpolyglutamate synthase/dihydrofolate synthase [bacterium]|nr:bifunctional folylpolyglutamate synthase/dihydrofolate synthase [bacterium]
MTDYPRTLDWLYALEAAKGMDFKLERVALALRRLGDPQRAYPALHIAGTNGKGSVAAMLDACLGAAGYRVGRYTSPHLVELGERITIGGVAMSRQALVATADEVRAATLAHGIGLTFFEILTVMAFLHFARVGIDVAVVEVGLGGRLDATNVIDPLAAVITTIGLDHTQWLGDTVAAIAVEKGGIIKPGRPVVLGRIGGEALAVLLRLARERGAPVLAAGRDYRVEGEERLSLRGAGWTLRDLEVGLRGAHQRDNAATALAALGVVRAALPVNETAVRQGLRSVRWPGRLEVIGRAPLTIVDGAHNRDGIDSLTAALPGLTGGRPVDLLFAVMADKDWPAMVTRLAPFCRSVVVTEALPRRAAPAAAVAAAFPAACAARAEPDVERAWGLARQRAGRDGVVLACGSLFLIGALYELGVAPGAPVASAQGAAQP